MRHALRSQPIVWAVVVLPSLLIARPDPAADEARVTELLAVLDGVAPEGADNETAARAWAALSTLDAGALPALLGAIDRERPVPANWIRAAVDSIAERTLKEGGALPRAELNGFVADRENAPRARRLAYEWLLRFDSTAAERWIPKMLTDPSVEFRRDAVERLLLVAKRADAAQEEAARAAAALYRETLRGARDEDQVKLIVERLRAYGEEVDLATHFGFLQRWKIAGPFDNTEVKGFHTAYTPEQTVALEAEYEGKTGPVRWVDYVSDDEYGLVDLNQGLAKEKEVLGYAYHEFSSAQEQDVELRVGSKNAFKIWVNGGLVYERDEYHHGTKMDHYRAKAHLKTGKNAILVKLCQNHQTEPWTVEWEFQLRVCDATGTAILSTTRLSTGATDDSGERKDAEGAEK